MNKLEERFEEIIWDSTDGAAYKEDFCMECVKRDCANEAKKIAINFAEHLFISEITKSTSMTESEKYWPHEFQLMLGELIKNGDFIFNKFIEEYYGE